jgi:hypothetical protein
MRAGGRNFVEINEEIKRGKGGKIKEKGGKHRGKGKGTFKD